MIDFIKLFNLFLSVLCLFNILYDLFFRKEIENGSENNAKNDNSNIYWDQVIMKSLIGLLCFITAYKAVLYFQIIHLIFKIIYALQILLSIALFTSIIWNLATTKNIENLISFEKHTNILIGISAYLLLTIFIDSHEIYIFFENIHITPLIKELIIVSFILISIFFELTIFMLLIYQPIIIVSKLLDKSLNTMDIFVINVMSFIGKLNIKPKYTFNFTYLKKIEYYRERKNIVKKMLLGLSVCIAIPFDILKNYIYLMFWGVEVFVIGSALFILDTIHKAFQIIGKGLKYCTKYSEGLVVKNYFRISGLITITTLVYITHGLDVISKDIAFISTLDFLASAIVIPIILEWIYSSTTKKREI